jgi:hypothetical protein
MPTRQLMEKTWGGAAAVIRAAGRRTSWPGRVLGGLTIAALVGAGGGVPGGTAPGGAAGAGAIRLVSHVQAGKACGWAVAQIPSPPADSLLGGVATRSPVDAWAVGGSRSAAGDSISALIEHWNGTAWRVVPGPAPGQSSVLSGVAIVSASNAWAVGSYQGTTAPRHDQALIEHWTGRSWNRVTSPHPGGESWLTAVAVVSARNAWAVGAYANQVGGRNKLFTVHWNGKMWRQVPVPVTASGVLYAVAATSWSDVWAVGQAGNTVTQVVILHWNGQGWQRAAYRGPAGSSYLTGVAATSARDAWAVGTTIRGTGAGPAFTVRWTGRKWQRVPIPDAGTIQLSAVTAVSSRDAWAVGGSADHTVIEHWDGTSWATGPGPAPGVSRELTSVAASSASNVWAVGSYHVVPSDLALALHCT